MKKSKPVYYFAGSIRAGRQDVDLYRKVINHLKMTGEVMTEHVGDYALSLAGQNSLANTFIHDRDLAWLRRSDVVVAETTRPSLGVGYELAMATTYKIPIIALHRPKECLLSAMIAGCNDVRIIEYEEINHALVKLDEYLETVNV